jgi:hypothetical protein
MAASKARSKRQFEKVNGKWTGNADEQPTI